jgi:hypothetical protein
MREEDVARVSAEENTGVEEYILDPEEDIPEMIDLRDMDGTSSLVVELFPSLTKIEVEIALGLMIRGFYDGAGTDWVPMGNALRKVLRFLRANLDELTAGDMYRWRYVLISSAFANCVNSEIEEYMATGRKSLIECNLQSGRGAAKALDEKELLSRALEVEKEKTLEVIAEREDESLSAAVSKHSLIGNELQEKLEKALKEKGASAEILQE